MDLVLIVQKQAARLYACGLAHWLKPSAARVLPCTVCLGFYFCLTSSLAAFGLDDQTKTQSNITKVGAVTMTRPKIGLALGGGGVRAAAHVGVLKVLEEEGSPVDVIVGSSTGAVVGGLYSAGMTPMHIEEQFTKRSLCMPFSLYPWL